MCSLCCSMVKKWSHRLRGKVGWLTSLFPMPERSLGIGKREVSHYKLLFYGNRSGKGIANTRNRHNILRTIGIWLDFLS